MVIVSGLTKSLHTKGCVAQGDTRLEAINELESNEIDMARNRQNTAYLSVKLTPTQSKILTPSVPLRLDGVFL